jgi:type II secretory pathway pseudopilin PulG
MKNRDKGFAIVAVLVAVVIIGILAVLLMFVNGGHPQAGPRVKDSAAKADIDRLTIACQAYQTDFGVYPPDDAAFSTVPLVEALSTIGRRGAPYWDFEPNRLQDGKFVSQGGKDPRHAQSRFIRHLDGERRKSEGGGRNK